MSRYLVCSASYLHGTYPLESSPFYFKLSCTVADNALPCEALRCPFVFGSGYDDFRKDLANRQQVHAPVGSFLGGFSKSASPNRTVELSGRSELPACTLRVCRSA